MGLVEHKTECERSCVVSPSFKFKSKKKIMYQHTVSLPLQAFVWSELKKVRALRHEFESVFLSYTLSHIE